MTQDEIIAMAKQAGAAIGKPTPTAPEIIFTQSLDIRLFAKLVAAHEREACAKVCDQEIEEWGWDADVVDVGMAIRARGQQ